MSLNSPPIRDPWKLDENGKLVSLPWLLWLQRIADADSGVSPFSESLAILSTVEASTQSPLPPTPASDVDTAGLIAYTPSSSSISIDVAELLSWMSF
jgi:hypothetical protein